MMDKNFLPPEDREFADRIELLAERVKPNAAFERELEKRLMQTQSPEPKAKGFFTRAVPAIGLALGLIVLALVLTRILRSVPPQPAAGGTSTPAPNSEPTSQPIILEATVSPEGETYEYYGQTIFLNAPFPVTPAQVGIYQTEDQTLATIESVRALAAQFGMAGQVYQTPDLTGKGQPSFLAVDGSQRLEVTSDRYFTYYPDFTRWRMPVVTTAAGEPTPEIEATIADFLQAKGFNFQYKLTTSQLFGAYVVQPLTPDGFPIVHEYFNGNSVTIRMDGSNILSAEFSLLGYSPIATGSIVGAEDALKMFLDENGGGNFLMGMSGGNAPQQEIWYRSYPKNETVTIWGYVNSFPSLEGGAPLVTFDGYTATGDFSNLPAETWMKFIQATGQIQTENGADIFVVESWTFFQGTDDGYFGTLQRVGADVQLVTDAGETFTIPDVPDDIPLPKENMYLVGVRQENVFEWKSMEYWPNGLGGGGGGGGGGIGFYKLNLTGSPVPFPTATASPVASADGIPYVVVEGDTCASIAAAFIVSVNDIITLNNMPADCSTLAVGQTIYLPFAENLPPQEVNLRGIVSITIFEKEDGSQRVNYGLMSMNPASTPEYFYYFILQGENLEELQKYNGLPVDVWGMIDTSSDDGLVTLNVERFEIPFPDLQYQIVKGVESSVDVDGQSVTLFTDENGGQFVEVAQNCYDPADPALALGITTGEPVLLEALAVPDVTYGGYPVLCVISMAQAINPKNGEPMQMEVTANKISILPEQSSVENGTPPTLTIERIELVYYVANPRYLTGDLEPDQRYIQPAWLFIGHYSNGDQFFIIVQALTQDYLLPELAPFTPPG